jgi:unsaturated rhamnogalacturonyl hydrolase
MSHRKLVSFLIAWAAAALPAGALAEEEPAKFGLTNPGATARTGAVVGIPWREVVGRVPGVTAASLRVLDPGGKPAGLQVFPAVGAPEELLVLTPPLAAAQRLPLRIVAGEGEVAGAGVRRVGARYAPEHRSDIAWENDRMAFRVYGPGHRDATHAGGIDVWSKRTREPILAKWYKTGVNGDYEVDLGEGCDATKVGAGPGCGATAYLAPDGTVVMSPVFASWKVLAEGPLRAVVELVYHPVEVGPASITETRRISYDLGAPVFRIEARFTAVGDAANIRPLAGMLCPDEHALSGNVATTWFSADKGEALNGRIGLGLILPQPAEVVARTDRAVFFPLAGDLSAPVVWHAGASWSKALDSPTPEAWERELRAWSAALAAPVRVE